MLSQSIEIGFVFPCRVAKPRMILPGQARPGRPAHAGAGPHLQRRLLLCHPAPAGRVPRSVHLHATVSSCEGTCARGRHHPPRSCHHPPSTATTESLCCGLRWRNGVERGHVLLPPDFTSHGLVLFALQFYCFALFCHSYLSFFFIVSFLSHDCFFNLSVCPSV